MTNVKPIDKGYKQNNYTLNGSNISICQDHTSIPLAKWLYNKYISCIGTIQTNRKGLLKEIKEIKGKVVGLHVKKKGVMSISIYTLPKLNRRG